MKRHLSKGWFVLLCTLLLTPFTVHAESAAFTPFSFKNPIQAIAASVSSVGSLIENKAMRIPAYSSALPPRTQTAAVSLSGGASQIYSLWNSIVNKGADVLEPIFFRHTETSAVPVSRSVTDDEGEEGGTQGAAPVKKTFSATPSAGSSSFLGNIQNQLSGLMQRVLSLEQGNFSGNGAQVQPIIQNTYVTNNSSGGYTQPPALTTVINTVERLVSGGGVSSQWDTNGSNVNYSTGNVGIGSSTPAAALGVTGSGIFTGDVTANAFYGDGSHLTGISAGSSFSTSTTRGVFSSSATGLDYDNTTGIFSLTSGYDIPLTASTTEWASKVGSQWTTSGLDISYTSGNVGIGTASPTHSFQVEGDALIGENITRAHYSTSSLSVANSAASLFRTQLNIINAGGGADTGTGIDFFTYDDPSSVDPEARISTVDDGNYSNSFVFSTKVGGAPNNSLAERLRIGSDGTVGIGTAVTGLGKFVVAGDSGANAAYFGGSGVSGNSYGLHIAAGTTAGDYALRVTDQTRTSDFFRITGAGNVGIGTTTPGVALSVVGAGNFTGDVTANAFYGDGSHLTGITSFSTSTTRSVFSSSATGLSYDNSTGIFSLTSGYNIPLTASTTEWANKVGSQWTTSGSNIYYSTGNVGVGTSTPSAKLAVTGTAGSGNIFRIASSTEANMLSVDSSYVNIGSVSIQPRLNFVGTGVTSYLSVGYGDILTYSATLTAAGLQTSGSITTRGAGGGVAISNTGLYKFSSTSDGAGTADAGISRTAAGALEINSGTTGTWRDLIVRNLSLGTTSTSTTLTLQGDAGKNVVDFASSTGVSLFRLTQEGNLGIGTTTPSAKLAVTGTAGTGDIFAIASSTEARLFTVTSAGNVGIGTASPTQKLEISGGYAAIGGVTIGGNNISFGAISAAMYWPNATIIETSANGLLKLSNYARNDFGRLQLGGTTSAFPAIKRNGAGIDFRLADDTGYATTTAQGGIFNGDVGIGTTTPSAKFAITGTAGTGDIFRIASSTDASLVSVDYQGALTLGAGSAASPVIKLGGSTNTGIFQAGTGLVSFSSAGSELFRISTGSLVYNFAGTFVMGNGTKIGFNTTPDTYIARSAAGALEIDNGSVGTWRDLIVRNLSLGTTSTSTTLTLQGDAGKNVVDFASSTGVSLFRLTQEGNLGIGTTTPSAKLAVTGTSGTGDIFRIASSTNASLVSVDYKGRLLLSDGSTASPMIAFSTASSSGFYRSSAVGGNGFGWTDTASAVPDFTLRGSDGRSFTLYPYSGGMGVNGGNVKIFNTNPLYILSNSNGVTTYGALGASSAGALEINSGTTGTWRDLIVRNLSLGTTSTSTTLTLQGDAGKNVVDFASSTGVSLFRLTQEGNLGIGTTTPSAKLAVTGTAGTADIFTIASSTNASLFKISSTGALYVGNNAGTSGYVLQSMGISGLPQWVATSTLGIGGSSQWTTSGSNIYYTTGNVSIGTTTPTATLSLYNAAGTANIDFSSASSTLFTLGTDGSDNNNFKISTPSFGGNDVFVIVSNVVSTSYSNPGGTGNRTSLITVTDSGGILFSNDTNHLINGSNGNGDWFVAGALSSSNWIKFDFGVGHVKVIQEATYTQQTSATQGVWKWQGSNDNSTWIDIGNSFTLGGATTDVITELSGNTVGYRYYRMLGVSGSTNAGPLVYQMDFKITESTGGLPYVGINDVHPSAALDVTGWGSGTNFTFRTQNSVASSTFTVLDNGNVGIGTTTPDQALVVYGSIRSTSLLGGATNLTTDANGNIIRDPSDIRLKDNVESIDSEKALDKVLALRGVTFEWKDKVRFGTQTEVGFIAQEVQGVVPEAVSSGGDYLSLSVRPIVAMLVEAIRELNKKIEAMFAWFSLDGTSMNIQGKICVDDVCVTKEQFKNLLISGGAYSVGNPLLSHSAATSSPEVYATTTSEGLSISSIIDAVSAGTSSSTEATATTTSVSDPAAANESTTTETTTASSSEAPSEATLAAPTTEPVVATETVTAEVAPPPVESSTAAAVTTSSDAPSTE